MLIDVTLTIRNARSEKANGNTAIVLDVLRATSTIVTALANGCHSVIPVSSPEEALNLKKSCNGSSYLLAGESSGTALQGFQMGNSPSEYLPEKVKNKKIILSTTNGTKAINRSNAAKEVFIGSLLNAHSVAQAAIKSGRNLLIFCAGTRNSVSLEDTVTAGLIIDYIKKKMPQTALTDNAKTAHKLYRLYRNRLSHTLLNSVNGRNLVRLGLGLDILHCSRLNLYRLVPRYKNGIISI